MKYFLIMFASISLIFSSCSEPPVDNDSEVELVSEDDVSKDVLLEEDKSGPVIDCDEKLSAVELRELWEMMNADAHHEKHVCLTGYVYKNTSENDVNQGMIAFKPFTTEDEVVPAVFCKFTGKNNAEFDNYDVGDKIEIMGEMLIIEDMQLHNFMLDRCSLPDKDGIQ